MHYNSAGSVKKEKKRKTKGCEFVYIVYFFLFLFKLINNFYCAVFCLFCQEKKKEEGKTWSHLQKKSEICQQTFSMHCKQDKGSLPH